jgi:hypothetical protein
MVLSNFGLHHILKVQAFPQWYSIKEAHVESTYEIQFVKSQSKIRHRRNLNINQQKQPLKCLVGAN